MPPSLAEARGTCEHCLLLSAALVCSHDDPSLPIIQQFLFPYLLCVAWLLVVPVNIGLACLSQIGHPVGASLWYKCCSAAINGSFQDFSIFTVFQWCVVGVPHSLDSFTEAHLILKHLLVVAVVLRPTLEQEVWVGG